MRLTGLELQGFKSFAKKTELQFGDGLTAIVGPNGSGKSNISDAIRWVLGEQSPKALRGSRMDDVIFNGTQKRRAQSFCEVTLTFDNSDSVLNSDYAELSITRRAFRNGGSEYSMNGTQCRLMDIQELFRDTGIGKDGYSIISQGRVDEILSGKSGDRRLALEEAAGVMRYRTRKEDAERRLTASEKNMERIGDIMSELVSQVEPLKIQSEKAMEYLKLNEELRDLDVNMFLYQCGRNTEKTTEISASLRSVGEHITENERSSAGLLESCNELDLKIHEFDERISAQQAQLISITTAAEQSMGDYRLLGERKANAERELERLMTERPNMETKLAAIVDRLKASDAFDESSILEIKTEIDKVKGELDNMDKRIEELEALIESMKNAMMEEMNRQSDARVSATRYDAMLSSLSNRLEALAQEKSNTERRREQFEAEFELAKAEQAEIEGRIAGFKSELDAAIARCGMLERDISGNSESRSKAEQHRSEAISRLNLLKEMKRSREGYQNSVRLLMRDAESDRELASHIIGAVAELIDVPAQFEIAISMALGGALQNIVTDNSDDAKAIINYVRVKDYGRITVLPQSMLSSRSIAPKDRELLNAKGCLGLAGELIACDERARTAIDHLLGGIAVVSDLDSGVTLKKRYSPSLDMVTLQGDYISKGGAMTGGSVKNRDSILGRDREISTLGAAIKKDDKLLLEITHKAAEFKKQIMLADVQVNGFRQTMHDCELELAAHREKLGIIERDGENATEHLKGLEDERIDILESIQDVKTRREQSVKKQDDSEKANIATREDIIKKQHSLSELRRERENVMAKLTELKVKSAAEEREALSRNAERKRLEGEKDELEKQLIDNAEKLKRQNADIAECDRLRAKMEADINQTKSKAQSAHELQRGLESERSELMDRLRDHRLEREELITTHKTLDEQRYKLEMGLDRLKSELEALHDRLWENYEITYESAEAFRHEIAVQATGNRINALKTAIRALGSINADAPEDYRRLNERYTELTRQYDDLTAAVEDLKKLIAELTHTMEAVFSEEFGKVRKNFNEVFTQLFGGGYAELKLTDEKDVLNCEIEIIAQPPGKKLQLLSLLSGGERAMTAIALLFAMLQLKAPAFCVLDEIETSLDEENVDKFASFIKAYSEDTQFILITHRKGSMAACDTLYGAVMEEKGVTSIVSARFEEA